MPAQLDRLLTCAPLTASLQASNPRGRGRTSEIVRQRRCPLRFPPRSAFKRRAIERAPRRAWRKPHATVKRRVSGIPCTHGIGSARRRSVSSPASVVQRQGARAPGPVGPTSPVILYSASESLVVWPGAFGNRSMSSSSGPAAASAALAPGAAECSLRGCKAGSARGRRALSTCGFRRTTARRHLRACLLAATPTNARRADTPRAARLTRRLAQ